MPDEHDDPVWIPARSTWVRVHNWENTHVDAILIWDFIDFGKEIARRPYCGRNGQPG